ncbi:MAG: SDR family NAD(P)-dependent oxidoreductase [Flavobacteriaceae bacterium]
MIRFQDQVAVIAGGARGIGRTVAKRLLQEKATVHLIDILEEDLLQSKKEFATEGFKTDIHLCDICDKKELNKVIQKIVVDEERLNILVNSAGIIGPSSTKIIDYPVEDFRKVVEVNLTGSFLLTKAVLPQMLKQNYGRIVHLSSIGGKEGNPGMAGYVASKSGLIGLIKGLGKEYAQTGITINGIAPAVIATPMNKDTDPEMMAYMTSKIPMGRLGTPEEVAAMACWVVSKEASFTTGYIFDLSGGRATY